MAPVLGLVIFIVLVLLDILGHRKFQVRRKILDWVFLCLFVAGIFIFAYLGVVRAFPQAEGQATGRYLAYRYLMDDDADGAKAVILQDESMSETSAEFLRMLAYGVEGDYKKLYFASDAFLSDSDTLPNQEGIAEELYSLAMKAVADGSNPHYKVLKQVEESYGVSGIAETVELNEYYEIDSKVKSGSAAEITSKQVQALLNSFPEEQNVKKLAVSYYVQTGDFDQALETAKVLLEERDSAQNRIIYTDVLAQMAYTITEDQIRESEDKEILALLKKADAATEKADSFDPSDDNAAKQKENALAAMESIPDVYYQRIENYIHVKKPFLKDTTGLYELQLIKMQLLQGETEEAYEAFTEYLAKASSLSENSPVRADLIDLSVDILNYRNSDGEEEEKEIIFKDCLEVFRSQGQDVISVDMEGINSAAAMKLASEILYDRQIFKITGISLAEYPKVTVSVNTNVQKGNIFGGSGEFYKDDFRVKENSVSVDDIALNAKVGVGERSLVIIADLQNEEQATAVRETLLRINNSGMAKRISLMDGNGTLLSASSDSDARYRQSVRALGTSRGAAITGIISVACEALSEKNVEDKKIIYITDRTDLDEDTSASAISILKENGASCYIAAFNGSDALDLLANESGAAAFDIGRAEELPAAMQTITDLMNNNYRITFKTEDDVAGRHTVIVSLTEEELEAEAEYFAGGAEG